MLLTWKGFKVVYDAHEDLPRQILAKPWIPGFLRKPCSVFFECFEDLAARRFAGIVTATPHIAARFSKVNANTRDVNNFSLPNELAPPHEGSVRERRICYVGGISRIRGIRQLIEAMALLPDVRLELCGQFENPILEQEMRDLPGWKQVDYRGLVGRGQLQEIMSRCSAGVVTFLPLPNHVDAQPNKMFEYMSAELPVVSSDFPLWREIIDGAGAGVCVDPAAPERIADAVRAICDDPALVAQLGQNGRRAVLEKYNWPSEARKLIDFYSRLM